MSPGRKVAAGIALVIGLTVVGAAIPGALGRGTKPTLEEDLAPPVGKPIPAPAAMTLVSADANAMEGALVSADRAFEVAWEQEGAPGNPKEASATFALFTWGSFLNAPVWVISYPDTCIPLAGPATATGAEARKPVCAAIPMNTLIDARTGEFILSFARSEGGYELRPID